MYFINLNVLNMYICYCNSRIYFLAAQLSLIILTPLTREDQALLPMEFSRQEYQSGVPFPTPYIVVPVQLLSRVCNPMDCSTPGLPVHHFLLEFAQVHVH